jgi:hypothetical protein
MCLKEVFLIIIFYFDYGIVQLSTSLYNAFY